MSEVEAATAETPLEIVWEGGDRYRGGETSGPRLLVDGSGEASPSPVQALLIALAACSAIDVVEILRKRRTPPVALRVGVEFTRAPSPPRRVTAVELTYQIAGDAERVHAERAIELSLEKYCSVSASLAPDTPITWKLTLEPGAPE